MTFLYLSFAQVILLFQVVTGQPDACYQLGGNCQITSLPCPYGYLPVTCGIYQSCCAPKPPTTKPCNKMGGFCRMPLNENCPSGEGFPANCGINARCCKPL